MMSCSEKIGLVELSGAQESWLRWVWASPWICVVLSRSELAGVMMEQTAASVLGPGVCSVLPGVPTFSTAFCTRLGISKHFITEERFLLTKPDTEQRRTGILWFKGVRRNV